MAKKSNKNTNLISLISLALIFLCAGVTFFILSFIDGLNNCSLIMAACSTILGLVMLGYYMCLSNPKKK